MFCLESNPGPQDGRRRWILWAMAASLTKCNHKILIKMYVCRFYVEVVAAGEKMFLFETRARRIIEMPKPAEKSID